MFRPLLLLGLLGFANGNAQSLHRVSFSHRQMGAVFRLVFYTPDSLVAAKHAAEIFSMVDTMNAVMSDYLPESELNRLCRTAGTGQSVPVSADLWRILRLSVRFSKRSHGAFDVTIGPLTRLWRRARNLQEVPDSSRIEAARALVNYRNIRFYHKGHCIELLERGMQLDLGGIAQGYAADACLSRLAALGYRSAMVDAGGDIAVGHPPPGAEGWRIEIPGQELPMVLKNCGITASGGSARYLEAPDGTRYSHIVDPRTGWGLTHPQVVVVRARNATCADAWATALSVRGEAGLHRIRQDFSNRIFRIYQN